MWPKVYSEPFKKSIWSISPYTILWAILNVRNDVIFRNAEFSSEAAVQRVKTTVWNWQEVSKNNLQTRKVHSFNEARVGWRQTFGSTGVTTQAGLAQINEDIAPGDISTTTDASRKQVHTSSAVSKEKLRSSISFLHTPSVKIWKEFTGHLTRFHTLDRGIAIEILIAQPSLNNRESSKHKLVNQE